MQVKDASQNLSQLLFPLGSLSGSLNPLWPEETLYMFWRELVTLSPYEESVVTAERLFNLHDLNKEASAADLRGLSQRSLMLGEWLSVRLHQACGSIPAGKAGVCKTKNF